LIDPHTNKIHIQQTSLNPTSYNSKILIIRHLRRVVPRSDVLFFSRKKKASSMKQADLRNIFKKASKTVCTSTIVVSPDPFSPTPSTSSAMKAPQNTKDDPEPATEGDVQMEYTSD
jgi:hypothetical protein